MTEEQFQIASDIFSSLRGVKNLIESLLNEERNSVDIAVRIPHYIEEAITTDIENIRLEHSKTIKAEILECLNLHVVRLQNDLDMI